MGYDMGNPINELVLIIGLHVHHSNFFLLCRILLHVLIGLNTPAPRSRVVC